MRKKDFNGEEEGFMRLALSLARKGRGMAHPNPLVGAVVVRDGRVVGRGFHRGPGTDHAEVAALRKAGEAARGATLFVTLEPCNHHGRTPPCTEAIRKAQLKRVVIARRDPNPRVSGGGVENLKEAGIEVEEGLLEEHARELNRGWEKFISTGLPFVTLKVGMAADGRIATRTGKSRWITGERSRRRVHEMRRASDAVLTGVGTVIADDPELTVREVPLRGAKQPMRVVLDSRLRIPPRAALTAGGPPTLILTTTDHDRRKAELLRGQGVRVEEVTSRSGRVCVESALRRLAEIGIVDVLVEAGTTLNSSLIEAGLVDRLCLFVAPKVIGGDRAPCWVAGEGVDEIADSYEFEWDSAEKVGVDLLLTAYRKEG